MVNDFKRARAMFAAVSALIHQFSGLALHEALAALGPYESRGHGRGKRSGVNVKALNKMSKHFNSNEYAIQAYTPWGGKKEIARRAAAFPQ